MSMGRKGSHLAKDVKLMIVGGARPNFMKIAPVVHALRADREDRGEEGGRIYVSIVHTGQHYDDNMSAVFFKELSIPEPDHYLGAGSGSHAEQTARIMVEFEKVLLRDRPDAIVVVGDVNSTIACALTAKKMGIRVAHVEAGLRSFDWSMPEEINRKLTDAISDFLFVTEESGIRNLEKEGVPGERVFLTGNVMIDSLRRHLRKIDDGSHVPCGTVRELIDGRPFAVLTLHRPTNVDHPEILSRLWGAILEVARRVPILFPVHPRTRQRLREAGLDTEGIILSEPLGYLDMLAAVRKAVLVLTDSGGLQEETTFLGVPCATMRENTERPSTIEVGTNYLVGSDPERIASVANRILDGKGKKGSIPPLWDGHAAERIVAVLRRELCHG